MRKVANVCVPIVLLTVILGAIYFRHWVQTARDIVRIQETQETDLTLLERAKERLQDLSTLQIALRVKLFGPAAADDAARSPEPPALSPRALPAAVVSALDRHSVRLVFYRQSGRQAQVQFEGAFDGVIKFLAATSADMPRAEGFLMERGEKNTVKLTLSFPVAA